MINVLKINNEILYIGNEHFKIFNIYYKNGWNIDKIYFSTPEFKEIKFLLQNMILKNIIINGELVKIYNWYFDGIQNEFILEVYKL